MKKIFLTILLFAAFAGYSQKRFYPKKFNANLEAIYLTNSNSVNDLSFLYTTPADTSKSIFLIENLKPSDVEKMSDQLQIHNLQFCPENYKTKIGDFVFSITSEKVMIYFYHLSDANSSDIKIN